MQIKPYFAAKNSALFPFKTLYVQKSRCILGFLYICDKIMCMRNLFNEFKRRAKTFTLQWRFVGYTLGVMLGATLLSALMHQYFMHNNNVSMIYALAVVVVSCITPGYFYGVVASLISVFGVNYFFTAPYWALNFSLTGYPITFLTLLVASIITSTLVTGYRERDRARHEAEAEKMRGNLLRAMSHDIRTPLTSISGASSALLENEAEIDTAQRRALIGDIYDNSQWLIRMVENLLSVTRIQGKGKPLQKTDELPEEVIAQAITQVRKRFPAQAIKVKVEGDPVLVPMDGTLVSQVIINLIENAIFHSGSTEAIEVYAAPAQTQMEFSIRDYGKGIDPNRIQRLMNGQILSNEMSDSTRGMGIGLSICAAIVRAHGGDISARNTEGGGAIFTFDIPLE